jgi:hypothetical protein
MKRRQIQLPPSGTGRYVPAEVIEMVCDEELEGRPLPPVVELLSPRLSDADRAAEQAKPDAPTVPPSQPE